MSQKVMTLISGILILLFSQSGNAREKYTETWIYFEADDAPSKIRTAREEAARVGARFMSIPGTVTKRKLIPIQNQIKEFGAKLDSLYIKEDEIFRAQGKAAAHAYHDQNQAAFNELNQKLAALEREARPLQSGAKDLRALLIELKKKRIVPNTLIFSGHSGGIGFYGAFGGIEIAELKQIMDEVDQMEPKKLRIQDSIRSIYRFGCYGGTPESHLQWKSMFPNTELLVQGGFLAKSPLASFPGADDQIRDILRKGRAALEKADLKKAVNSAKVPIKMGAYEPSLCIGDTMVSQKGKNNLSADCPVVIFRILLRQRRDDYDNYYNGNQKFEDVPVDTGHSKLRDFYTQLRRYEHCKKEMESHNLPTPDRVLRMIFYKTVRKNFELYYQDEIKQANQILEKIKPPKLEIPPMKALNRKKAQDLFHQMTELLLSNDFKSLDSKEQDTLKRFYNHIYSQLISLTPRCVPFRWIEPAVNKAELRTVPGDC